MSIARYEFYDNIGSMYELCSYYDSGFIMNELCSYISYMTFIMIPTGGQIWSQLHLIGLPGLDSWSPHTLTWYRALSTAQFYRVA